MRAKLRSVDVRLHMAVVKESPDFAGACCQHVVSVVNELIAAVQQNLMQVLTVGSLAAPGITESRRINITDRD